MDNTAQRTLSPLLLLGESLDDMLEMTHTGGLYEDSPVGVTPDVLRKLYGTAHYLLGCIAYKMAQEDGEWDKSYFENITIPEGWHHSHMLTLLLVLISLRCVKKKTKFWDEVHWLSLCFGMACRIVLYGPEHMLPAEGLLEAHKIRVDVFSDGAGNRIWARTSASSHF